jgi:hypothetical protein
MQQSLNPFTQLGITAGDDRGRKLFLRNFFRQIGAAEHTDSCLRTLLLDNLAHQAEGPRLYPLGGTDQQLIVLEPDRCLLHHLPEGPTWNGYKNRFNPVKRLLQIRGRRQRRSQILTRQITLIAMTLIDLVDRSLIAHPETNLQTFFSHQIGENSTKTAATQDGHRGLGMHIFSSG